MKKFILLLTIISSFCSADQGWLSGGIFSMTQADVAQLLSMGHIATPVNPPSGFNALYFKSDNNLYMLNSSGVETQVNGGIGSGANRYLSNLLSPTEINQSLLFSPDNTYDIGADGASRPGAIHAANHVTSPLVKGRDNVIGAGQHDITIRGGDGITGNKDGGNLTLQSGAKSGTGTNGHIYLKAASTTVMDINDGGVINLPALTASQLVATDASKNLVSLSRGNLTEANSSVLTITGGTSNVLDGGISIEVKQSSGSQSGYLSSSDWTTFNSKEPALTKGNLTEATSSVLTISGGSSSVIGSGTSIEVKKASASQAGYLDSADFSTFNNKLTSPMTNQGDIIVGGSSGAAQRLALGAVNKVLVSDGSTLSYQYAGLGGGSLPSNTIILGRGLPSGMTATEALLIGATATADDASVAIGHGAMGGGGTGSNNVAVGVDAITEKLFSVAVGSGSVARGTKSVALGYNNFTGTGDKCVVLGSDNGSNDTTGSNNFILGNSSGSVLSSGSNNILIGTGSGSSIQTGGSNTIIGNVAGSSSLSNTIILAAGSNERIRVDSSGNVGIGTTSPGKKLDVNGSTNLGGSLNIKSIHGQTGSSNIITVSSDDQYVGVNSSAAAKSVNLPASATVGAGRKITIKDEGGSATSKNITIYPNGSETIDGAASFVMKVGYDSITLISDGSNWFII